MVYYSIDKFDESVKDNTKAIELKPEFADAFINRGLSGSRINLYENALSDYVSALKITPDSELGYNNLVILLNDLLKLKEKEPLKFNLKLLDNIKKLNLSGNKNKDLLSLIDLLKK